MTAHARAQAATDSASVSAPTLQRACACGETAGLSGKCPGCAAEERLGLQPKLRVNPPGDRWEQEADRIADQVVSERPVALPGPLAVTSLIQRQPVEEEEDEEEETIQGRDAAAPATASARGANFAGRLAAEARGGHPLGADARTFFEPRLGRDLAAVRIHQGPGAAELSGEIGARAFTHRNHIFFAAGQLDTATAQGRHLMAHELAHTLQQTGPGPLSLQRVCSSAATCAAPIAGSPEDFSTSEEAVETGPRARRRAMTADRARSTGHAGRARQVENVLSAHDPAQLSLFHGIFIDADLGKNTGAMVTDCADWAADALPAGDPDPAGFATATNECVFVPGQLNREARDFNQGKKTVGGQPAKEWQVDTLSSLIHEAEHIRFDTTIEPGLSAPAGITTAACTKNAVAFSLSEIVSIMSQFPLNFDAAQAEASASGPAHRRLDSFLDDAVSDPRESLDGALTEMGCKCECNEVDLFIIQAADAVTTAWTAAQKSAFRTEIQARMLGPVRPIWPAAPTP